MGTIGKVTAGGSTHLLASTAYGTCATGAATAAKVATIQDSQAFTLLTGVTVHIKFTYTNTVANPTLNVNSTGAKAIMRYGTTRPSTSTVTSWFAGSVISFTYDGTYWVMNDWNQDANTTYSAGNGLALSSNKFSLAFSVGDVIMTNTNTNPNGHYGGTWSLIDKEFAYKWISGAVTTSATTWPVQAGDVILVGHTMEFKLAWQNNAAISDSAVTVGGALLSKIGVSNFHFYNAPVFSDGLNAIGMLQVSYTSGDSDISLTLVDWVTRATSYPTTTGQNVYANFVVNIPYTHMLDSFCDKFYWKKTA